MGLSLRRFDHDGVPVSPFWRYKGEHRARETVIGFISGALMVGAVVVAIGVTVPVIASRATTNEVLAAESDLLKKATSPTAYVGYQMRDVLAFNGKFCVHNPAVAGDKNHYLAALGRSEPNNPNTTMAVVIGEDYTNQSEIKYSNLVWSNNVGAFVASNTIVVGAGELIKPGVICNVGD